MEIVGHCLLDLRFEFGIVVNLRTDVTFQFVFDEVTERFDDQILG